MARDYGKIIAKLDRPPSGPNWVRFIGTDVPSTTKAIVSFAKGLPQFTYQTGYSAIRDRIQLGIDLATALSAARRSGAPAGRVQNEKLIEAFFEYDEQRGYAAQNAVEFERGWFMVSREVQVPVAPLSIIREQGNFVPVFVCGWSNLSLTRTQRRLLMTIYDDAFLSLTDYQSSPAEFLFFPTGSDTDEKRREAEVWKRGDYELLSTTELGESVEIFLQARDAAKQVLLDEWARQPQQKGTGSATSEHDGDDLFSVKK